MSTLRTRNWVFIAYPENISEAELDEYLENLQIECCRSPLHSPVGDGITEERKAHWHILLCFGGVKSYEQVKEISQRIGGCRPQVCNSVRGSVRYFVHADNPEKEQFANGQLDLKSFCGLNVFDLFCPTSSEKSKYLSEMQQFISDNCIYEFADLYDYARDKHFDTWYYLLNNGAYRLMQVYISSLRNKEKGQQKVEDVVEETIQRYLDEIRGVSKS